MHAWSCAKATPPTSLLHVFLVQFCNPQRYKYSSHISTCTSNTSYRLPLPSLHLPALTLTLTHTQFREQSPPPCLSTRNGIMEHLDRAPVLSICIQSHPTAAGTIRRRSHTVVPSPGEHAQPLQDLTYSLKRERSLGNLAINRSTSVLAVHERNFFLTCEVVNSRNMG